MFKSGTILKVARQACQQRLVSDAADAAGTKLQGARTVLTGERGVNHVTLLGRVGQDPEVRGSVENPVTVFSLATSFSLKTRSGEYVQRTEWHRISVFRPVLKDLVSQFVKKGDRVYVTGSISYGKFRDKSDNVKQITSIIAEDVLNMTRPMRGTASEAEVQEQQRAEEE